MKPGINDKDSAFYAMAMDILNNVLSHADNPGELGKYLAEEIRSLTGARCVLLIKCLDTPAAAEHYVVGVNPLRRRGWAESSDVKRLYEAAHSVTAAQLWREEEPAKAAGLLRREGFELSMVFPLYAGEFRMGDLLVLGLPDEEHINSALGLLNNLSAIVALVLRNTILYEKQEQIIRERTTELRGNNIKLTAELIERKRAEEQILKLNRIYAVLSNINQAIVRIHETEELLNEACRIAVEYGKFRMAWIGMMNLQTNKVDVAASNGVPADYLKKINIDLSDELRSNDPAGIAVKTGKHKTSNNIKYDDNMIPWRDDAAKYDYKSIAAFPFAVYDKVVGVFTIYSNETYFFDEEDIKLLDEMAKDISFALEFIESESERKKAEEKRLAHLRFFESLDKVNRAIQGAPDLEHMMSDVLGAVLSILDCDRAWLFYPCDPDAPSFRVPMEINRPKYPGAKVLNVDMPMFADMAQDLRVALASEDPVICVAGTKNPINKVSAEQFGVQSQMYAALYPKFDKPWVFGIHQCSYPRIWTEEEKKIFKEISRRLADALTGLLLLRNLKESEEKYRTLIQNIQTAVVVHGANTKIITSNSKAQELLGLTEDQLLGKTSIDPAWHLFREDGTDMLPEEYPVNQVFKTHQALRNFTVGIHRSGKENDVWALVNADPFLGKEDEITQVIVTFTDITKRKLAEEQVLKLNRIYAVLSNINQAIVRIHETGELFKEACRIAIEYGKFRMVWIGMVNSQTNKVDVAASNGVSGDYLQNVNIDLNDEHRSNGPVGIAVKTGKHKISNNINQDNSMIPWRDNAMKYNYKSVAAFPLIAFDKVVGSFTIYSNETDFFDEEDIKLLDEMVKDISFALEFIENETKRRLAEEKIVQSLREKETLIRELYHRTKNTMQIIGGIIILQADEYPDNIELQRVVKNVEDKIQAISLVHRMLYKSQDLSQISVKEYLHKLSALIMQSFGASADRISLITEIDDRYFLLDTAIPFGLIINELITNSLKYAFPDNRKGIISITLRRGESKNIILHYSDNGVGVADGFDFRNQNTLGLKLIYGISEMQLMGKVVMQNDNGVSCLIEFSDKLYKARV